MWACPGILFNHESPLRPERLVTQKAVRGACRIAAGNCETLPLGNLDIHREWGRAPEYFQVMWMMLQQMHVQGFVIATEPTVPLEYSVQRALKGLGWRRHVRHDATLPPPTDIRCDVTERSLALNMLGWNASPEVGGAVHGTVHALRPMRSAP